MKTIGNKYSLCYQRRSTLFIGLDVASCVLSCLSPLRYCARQGRTQDRADGAKAPPRNPPKKIIYSFKSGAFYVSQFLHPVADCSPDSID